MKQESLFEEKNDTRPLADRMRPETLDEYVGQKCPLVPLWLRRDVDPAAQTGGAGGAAVSDPLSACV